MWLDNTTRDLLDSGTLERYVTENSVTGLTSNPTIFDKAIEAGPDYDADIGEVVHRPGQVATGKAAGGTDEGVFFDLALSDLRRAADLFAPAHARTDGVDGWVSLEVSPRERCCSSLLDVISQFNRDVLSALLHGDA